jgi:hypothetical protein
VKLRVGIWRQNRGCGPCCSQKLQGLGPCAGARHIQYPLSAPMHLCTSHLSLPSHRQPASQHDYNLSPPQPSQRKARQGKASPAQPSKHEHEQNASRHLLTSSFPLLILLPHPIALLLNTSFRHRRASGSAIVIRSFVHFPAGSPPLEKTPRPHWPSLLHTHLPIQDHLAHIFG